jgi:hypothetical protein
LTTGAINPEDLSMMAAAGRSMAATAADHSTGGIPAARSEAAGTTAAVTSDTERWAMRLHRNCLFALLLLGGLAGPLPAQEEKQYIFDETNLFSSEAEKEANRLLAEGAASHDIVLVVETVKEMPPEWKRELRFWNSLKRTREVRKWVQERAFARAQTDPFDGAYALICEDPKFICVVPYPKVRKENFPDYDCVALERTFNQRKKEAGHQAAARPADEALRALVADFNRLVQSAGPANNPVHPSEPVLLVILAALFGLALVLHLVNRRRSSGPHPELPDQSPALLGSLFGSLPACWVYDGLLQPRPASPPRKRPASSKTVTAIDVGTAPTVTTPGG